MLAALQCSHVSLCAVREGRTESMPMGSSGWLSGPGWESAPAEMRSETEEEGGRLVALDVDDVDVGLVHRLQHAQPRVHAQAMRSVDPCAQGSAALSPRGSCWPETQSSL